MFLCFRLLICSCRTRANISLNRVQELRDSSRAVEEEAKKLQTDLQTTQQLSKEALDISTETLQLIQNEDSVLSQHFILGLILSVEPGFYDHLLFVTIIYGITVAFYLKMEPCFTTTFHLRLNLLETGWS